MNKENPQMSARTTIGLSTLLARDLIAERVGDGYGGWTVVANEHLGNDRWSELRRLVIRDNNGNHWATTYSMGLTEAQEGPRPWEYDLMAQFEPVEVRTRTITEYVNANEIGKDVGR